MTAPMPDTAPAPAPIIIDSMTVPALKVSNLSVTLNTRTGVRTLVDNISFELQPGEAGGLVGESGCGKTLTAFAILGQLPGADMQVSSSAIDINGKDIAGLTGRQRRQVSGRDIAMIFQQPGRALDPVFTLGHQIEDVYQRHIGGNKKIVRQAALDSLAAVGFEQPDKIAAAYVHQLSGGMRQLVMIAMATVCKPAVLIADEPTTALDIVTRSLILQKIGQLQKAGNTAVLMISHDLSVIRQLCQQVMVMYCGRIVETAQCAQLFAHPRHPYSAGLINCIPDINAAQAGNISTIPGRVPSMGALPKGCHFEPRCSRAVAECSQAAPPMKQEEGSCFACYRPL